MAGSIASVFVDVRANNAPFHADLRKGLSSADAARLGDQVGASIGTAIGGKIRRSMDGVKSVFTGSGHASGKSFSRAVESSTKVDGSRHGRAFGTSFARGGIAPIRGMIGPLAAGFAAIGAANVFGKFISDARESNKIGALSAQVIKSTGGAAHLSAGQVSSLATAISNKTGVDDEAIQSGENLLLTFTNVRNEVGKGNDIFTQATGTITDMSVALGQDTKSSAIQLGKALNDPIKGVSALQRVGVSFTASQKDQIATLVKSGHTLDAQKVILRELGKEFGGAAAAASTPMDKLKVNLGNVGEALGNQLIPLLDKAATFMLTTGIPAFQRFGGFISTRVLPALRSAAGFVSRNFVPALVSIGTYLRDRVFPVLVRVGQFLVTNFRPTFVQLGRLITGTIAPGFVMLGQKIRPLLPVLGAVAAVLAAVAVVVLGKVLPVILRLAGPVLKGLFAALGLLIGTLTTVGGGLVTLGGVFVSAWAGISSAVLTGVRFVVNTFLGMVGAVIDGAAKAFGWVPGLGDKLKGAAASFDTFRDDVNRSLGGLSDQEIKVHVTADQVRASVLAQEAVPGFSGTVHHALGGIVRGPGGPRTDSIPAMLSNGEFVVNAEATRRNLGLLHSVNAQRYAAGGLVVGGVFPSTAAMAAGAQRSVGSIVEGIATSVQAAVQKAYSALGTVGPGGTFPHAAGDYQRINVAGKTLDRYTARMLTAADRLFASSLRLIQGSFSTRVSASGSTHAGGGAVDVAPGDGDWGGAVSAMRRVGFAAWHRTPSQGPWGHHIHAIAIGDAIASAAAKRQMVDFRRGGDGLGSMAVAGRGGRLLDQGGILPHGGVGVNLSGRPERVLSPAQTAAYDQAPTIHVYIGGERIDERVKVVVDRAHGHLADALTYGRR